MGPDSSER